MSDAAADAWRDDEPPPRHLAAGAWAVTLRGVSVEDVTCCGATVLSALRVVVRDHDWRTVPLAAGSVEVREAGGERLHVVLTGTHEDLGAGVRWRAELTTDGDRLRFAASGRVTHPFRRNRMGLVVLHPADVAGTGLRVRHPDGRSIATRFPDDIAPHQPALDVAGLDWSVGRAGGDLDLSLDLRGEVFEAEDQRNWTDASFKTYSTPLALPFPVPVDVGDGFEHVAELTAVPAETPGGETPLGGTPRGETRRGGTPGGGSPAPRFLDVPLDPAAPGAHPAPRVQLQASTAPGEVPPLAALGWRGPLLVELDATGRAWPGVLARAGREADLLGGAGLDVRITARDGADLDPVLAALRGHRVERVAAYDDLGHVTTPALWRHLRERAADLPLAGGTRAHFTELNRRRRDLPADLPALTFSSTPQMHDTGRRQLLQAVAVQRRTAEQAVRLAGGRPVHVGPVTLRPRFNAVATSGRRGADVHGADDVVAAGTGPHHVWGADDPRQAGRGLAAWLIASHQAFAVPGVASVTFCETWGPRGSVDAAGDPFPVAQAVDRLGELDGWDLLSPPLVPGLGLVAAVRAGRLVVLASDLTGEGWRIGVGGVELVVGPWGTARGEGSAPADRSAATSTVRG